MKKVFYKLLLVFTVLVISGLIFAVPIMATALFTGIVQVTNSSTSASNVATNFTLDTQSLIDNGFCASDLSDIDITYNSVHIPFMPGYGTNLWCLFLPAIGASSIVNCVLSTGGATGGAIRYFPGTTGASVPDHGSLELGGNGAVAFTDTYLDTTQNGTVFTKQGAIASHTLASGNTTVDLFRTALDFESTNSDYVTIPDSDDFSFTDGLGNDTSFTMAGWVKPETLGIRYFLSKATTATSYEWFFGHHTSGNLSIGIINPNATQYIQKFGNVAMSTGTWYHVAVTYDGSETAAGLKLYVNGSLVTDTSVLSAGYVGMSNNSSAVEFGRILGLGAATAYYDGVMSNFKIFKSRELSATEILSDYNGTFTDTTGMVAWYKFVDGAGNPTDSSGLAHNATANAADWITTGGMCPEPFLNVAVTAGEKDNITVSVNATSGNLTLWVDSVAVSSLTLGGYTIPDTSTNWYFGSSASTPYIDTMSVTVGGALADMWDWEYNTTFTGNTTGNIMTPSFRTTNSDADVSAELVSFAPTEDSELDSFTLAGELPDIGVPTAAAQMYTEENYSHIPGGPGINEVLNAAGVPYSLWWFPFIYISICFIGFIIYGATQGPLGQKATSNPYDGSLLTMAIVMEILIALFGIMNPVPLWPAYLFPIPALAIISSRKHTSIG